MRDVGILVVPVDEVLPVQLGAPRRQTVERRAVLVIGGKLGDVESGVIVVVTIPLEVIQVILVRHAVQLVGEGDVVGGEGFCDGIVGDHVGARVVIRALFRDLRRADQVAGQEVIGGVAGRLPEVQVGLQRRTGLALPATVAVQEGELIDTLAQMIHDPGAVDRGQQRRKVVTGINGQPAGRHVEAHALCQADLGDVAVSIQRKGKVTHHKVHTALDDAQHAAFFIGVEHGAVGQLVNVDAVHRIVAVHVAVKRVAAGQRDAAGQPFERVHQVQKRSGLRHGHNRGAGLLVDAQAFTQLDGVHAAGQRLNQAQFILKRAGIIGTLARNGCHHPELRRCQLHVHVARGGGSDPRIFTGKAEQECQERFRLGSHAARAGNRQRMRPERRDVCQPAGGAHRANRGQRAGVHTGEEEAHGAGGVCDQAAQVHISGSAALDGDFRRRIIGGLDVGIPEAGHQVAQRDGGADEAGVVQRHTLEGDVKVRPVDQRQLGQPLLVIHRKVGVRAAGEHQHPHPAGQVVGDIGKLNALGTDGPDLPLILQTHLAHQRGAIPGRDIDHDARRRVAEVEFRVGIDGTLGGGAERLAAAAVLDDEAGLAAVVIRIDVRRHGRDVHIRAVHVHAGADRRVSVVVIVHVHVGVGLADRPQAGRGVGVNVAAGAGG